MPTPRKLAIIVGHHAGAPGATGFFPTGKMSEYKFHRQEVVPRMVARCAELGILCQVFLRDGTDIGGVGRAVNKWVGKDIFACAIELHFNSASGAPKGTETLYDTDPTNNLSFAAIVHKRILTVLKRDHKTDRGIKLRNTGRGSYNVASVKCTSCLVEPAFCNVESEAKLLWDNRVAYAKTLVDGAHAWMTAFES